MAVLLSFVAVAQAGQPTGAMATARANHMAAKLPDGRVLVAGGNLVNGNTTTSVEFYDPTSGTFSAGPPMIVARSDSGVATLADGRILIIGGRRQSGTTGELLISAEIYDPANGSWTATAGSLAGNNAPADPTTVVLSDGRVMVISSATYQVFNPATGQFSMMANLGSFRSGASAALLQDGRVLLAGGQSMSNVQLASAEIWNPATETWTPTGSMATPRTSASAATLADGRVLLVGGINSSSQIASVELFDPATQTFSATGSLTNARSSPAITTLADGSVLVSGGYVSTSHERYDAAAGSWSNAGSLDAARPIMFTATRLDNGNVLFTGGYGSLTTAELYVAGGNVPPTANFSQSIADLSVTFTDASVDPDGTIASRLWNFGDGTTSTAANPVKTYAAYGNYSVVLSVTDNAGATHSITKAIIAGTPPNVAPVANFSYMANSLAVTFSDSSSDSDGSIVSRSWNFGDGTSSTATNPSKTYAAAGSYSVSLTVTDNRGATNTRTVSLNLVAGGCSGTALCNGVAVTGLSGGTTAAYTLVVPAGATNLKFVSAGGTGDADMYVKFGSAPTTSSYDCRPYAGGNAETCTISNVQTGTYYVVLVAYSSFSGVSLTGSYTAPGSNIAPVANFSATPSGLTVAFTDSSSDADGSIASRSWNFGDGTTSTATSPSKTYAAAGTYTVSLTVTDNAGATHTKTAAVTVAAASCSGTVLCNGVAVTGLSAGTGVQTATYTLVVPAGASNLRFDSVGGVGDADLYVKFGSAPTTASYDCRPYLGGNSETCTITNVQAGTYYVMLRAFSTFSGVSLKGSYTTP